MIAKIPQLDPVDATIDGNSGLHIAQLAIPLQIDILCIRGKVMAYFVYDLHFRL